MKDAAPQTIHLKDYQEPHHWVRDVHLTFRLAPRATRVLSKITFVPNVQNPGDLILDGEGLRLIAVAVNEAIVPYEVTDTHLVIKSGDLPAAPFTFEAEVEISPKTNTALEGLYMSPLNAEAPEEGGRESQPGQNAMYCTQCEAEGFRKITYYPDRPDVMAPFSVRVESDMPVMLSNGNPGASGPGFAEWHDPWPKPSYLFALVAGNLINHPGAFTTKSGKQVELNIWVRPGDEGKCAFGMQALKDSMAWDERVYGREYDLDIFNIVAVDDFNMGAMENKGLNVFNSSCVLASKETSTDANFERIEGIIAHEYFHNWTGNRITCRDWFQLCLKEGLTVYRDQMFSGDMRSHAVKRIEEVLTLRARQFREDNGPLAHPVRPESFVEINNFYTATVYEKGAEIIGMLKRLVGDEAYKKSCDLYFERHDGQAVTIEDWLAAFADTTGRDLAQFKQWYSQAGTPRLSVEEDWQDGTFTLTFTQSTPATPGQTTKTPMVLPIAVGLIGPNGDEVVPTTILEMTEATQSFVFEGLGARPTASILRDFSAPVVLEREMSAKTRAFLLAHDTDPFQKWEMGRMLAKDTLIAMIMDGTPPANAYLDAIKTVLTDDSLDPAFRALTLGLPSQDDLAQTLYDAGVTPDPDKIYAAREEVRRILAAHLREVLPALYVENDAGAFAPDAEGSGKRSLRLSALSLLTLSDGGATARALYKRADNMTEQAGALQALLSAGLGEDELADFAKQWQDDRLVMDKWFMMQVASAAPDQAADTARSLTQHPDFTMKNPNRFRSVFGALAGNHAGFHASDGKAYALLADHLIALDALNPQTTARMSGAFETWKRYDADRQGMMRDQLERILATPTLSRDTTEMVTRILSA
ncbi:MAG: aminopeptidase N [Alphaproteobacteria bacterium]|nr:aminopeptidase N [Alphaproteobacteria bacterium]MBU1573379.1 aminopeptidase N [Alphaproteobacteria bacterium]MBU1828447.1 aminopeptidase N [Alphaproteobacteria bacterium]MBU2079012.1 aminopeptidase N [Alphaproteobacteria bacterium]MBU2159943.1 aminopeptidase N [Alphaproteobacteria bacterium]